MRFLLGPRRRGRTAERRRILPEVHRDTIQPGADPHHFPGRAELVELTGVEARDAPREHIRLPERDGERESLQRNEGLTQRGTSVDAVPMRQEAAESGLFRRLDLLAQCGE